MLSAGVAQARPQRGGVAADGPGIASGSGGRPDAKRATRSAVRGAGRVAQAVDAAVWVCNKLLYGGQRTAEGAAGRDVLLVRSALSLPMAVIEAPAVPRDPFGHG